MKSLLLKLFLHVCRNITGEFRVENEIYPEEDVLDTIVRKMFRTWAQHIYLPDIRWQQLLSNKSSKIQRLSCTNRSKSHH